MWGLVAVYAYIALSALICHVFRYRGPLNDR